VDQLKGLWYSDYNPSLEEIVGNEKAKKGFVSWLNYRLNPSRKPALQREQKNCALIYGPPGTGKTALVKAAAKEMGILLMQLDASELRSKDEVSRLLDGLGNRATLFGETKKALLIDDADAIYDDAIGYQILNLAKQAKSPVILTAVSKYARSLRFLRGMCAEFSFTRLSADEVLRVLKDLSKKFNVYAEESELNQIAKGAGGDARAAINDLQSWAFGFNNNRDSENEVKIAVEKALSTDSCSGVLSSLYTALSSSDPQTIMLWIDENLPYFTETGLSDAYDWLARGDSMRGLGERKLLFNLQRRGLEVAACGIANRQPHPGEGAQIPWRLFRGREKIEAGKERTLKALILAEKTHMSTKKLLSDESFKPLEESSVLDGRRKKHNGCNY